MTGHFWAVTPTTVAPTPHPIIFSNDGTDGTVCYANVQIIPCQSAVCLQITRHTVLQSYHRSQWDNFWTIIQPLQPTCMQTCNEFNRTNPRCLTKRRTDGALWDNPVSVLSSGQQSSHVLVSEVDISPVTVQIVTALFSRQPVQQHIDYWQTAQSCTCRTL